MNVLLITKRLGCSSCVSLGRRGLITIAIFAFVVVPVLSLYGGYQLGRSAKGTPAELVAQLGDELDLQKQAVEDAKRASQENLNALTQRLGQLQAHVMRLNALGQRLTEMAKLEDGEFDFEQEPARGGPDSGDQLQPVEVKDFVAELDELAKHLEDRGHQLDVLETMLINKNLQAEISPTGRPVKKGYLTSMFGYRSDPFNGGRRHHAGIDFAGKQGSEIVAVASGVVVFSGERSGYGVLVEINHGNGYITRYGHNQANLVKVGDTVKRGQVIALLGSTGRSTGPHVHFEVLHNGKHVNPLKFVQASR